MMSNKQRVPAELITAPAVSKIIISDLTSLANKVDAYLNHLASDFMSDGSAAFTAACAEAEKQNFDLLSLAAENAPEGEQLNPNHAYTANGKKNGKNFSAAIHFQKFPKLDEYNVTLSKIAKASKLSDQVHVLKDTFGSDEFPEKLLFVREFVGSASVKSTLSTPRNEGTKEEETTGARLLTELATLLADITRQYSVLAKPTSLKEVNQSFLTNVRADYAAFIKDLPENTDEEYLQKKKIAANRLNDLLNAQKPDLEAIKALIAENNFRSTISAENTGGVIYGLFSTTPSRAFLNNLDTQVDYHNQRKILLDPPKVTIVNKA